MQIKNFIFNPFMENTYVLSMNANDAIVIDAGCLFANEKNLLKSYLTENNLDIKYLLNTHLHLDHQFGNKFLFDTFGIKPLAHPDDEYLLNEILDQAAFFGLKLTEDSQSLGGFLSDKETISFDKTYMEVLHIPGHTPGHVVFYFPDEGVVFTGDVLFKGSIGRTDFPKGNYTTLLQGVKTKLLSLPDSTMVYPGHGPSTTIGEEKRNNPFLIN